MTIAVGDPAPQFSGTDVLTGAPFSLSDQQGQVVVVAFSGLTYCAPCQLEAPVLQELSGEYPFVQFVMVELEGSDPGPGVPAAIEKFGITFPVILDAYSGPIYYPIMAAYAAPDTFFYIPQLFVLSTDHTVCATNASLGSADALKAELAEMLENCRATHWVPSLAPQEFLAVAQILFGVVQDGGGLTLPGGKIPPWSPLRRLDAPTRDTLTALAIHQLSKSLTDRRLSTELREAALRLTHSSLDALADRARLEEAGTQTSVPPLLEESSQVDS